MKRIKGLSYSQIHQYLFNKRANFKSDCEFFPNFDVSGKVIQITNLGSEILIVVLTSNQKRIKIGSNMKNLRFKLL